MRENLVLPPSIINDTIVGLSKDKMSTVWWNTKTKKWVHKGSSLVDEIKSALDIANRQAPPNFIKLPVKPLEK